jgi:crossover junction endodeoxyribonuclease RuvC
MGISAKEFAELQRRMQSGGGPKAGSAQRALPGEEVPVVRMVLGIDPSLRGTGWGVVKVEGGRPYGLAHGTIRCPASWARSRCLLRIHEVFREVLAAHRAEVCAVEGLFHARNLRTAIIMGEARGAAMAAVAVSGLAVYEVAPSKVKLAVAGHGGARKIAVARMVQRMLGLTDLPEPDAADALAIALTYIQEAGRLSLNAPKRV